MNVTFADASRWAAHLRGTQKWGGSASPRMSELIAFCATLNCAVESRTVAGEAGRTFRDGRAWRIWIEEEAGLRRGRFTLAHEVGHLLVGTSGAAVDREEAWCDAFAAELLLPRLAVSRLVANAASDGMALVAVVAEEFAVTRSAALLRLNRLTLTNQSTLTFRLVRHRWLLYSTMCMPADLRYEFRSNPGTAAVLRTVPGDGRFRSYRLPLSVRGELAELSVSVARSGSFITAGLDRSSLAELRLGHHQAGAVDRLSSGLDRG